MRRQWTSRARGWRGSLEFSQATWLRSTRLSTCAAPCPLAAGPRADFATDEEWTRYKEQKETLPRAAFQFGVKRADGRKSHKELEKVGWGRGMGW